MVMSEYPCQQKKRLRDLWVGWHEYSGKLIQIYYYCNMKYILVTFSFFVILYFLLPTKWNHVYIGDNPKIIKKNIQPYSSEIEKIFNSEVNKTTNTYVFKNNNYLKYNIINNNFYCISYFSTLFENNKEIEFSFMFDFNENIIFFIDGYVPSCMKNNKNKYDLNWLSERNYPQHELEFNQIDMRWLIKRR